MSTTRDVTGPWLCSCGAERCYMGACAACGARESAARAATPERVAMAKRLHDVRVRTLNARDGVLAYKIDCDAQVEALEQGWSLQEILNVQLAVRIA